MRLPNGKRALVDLKKLRDYCLNPDSPRGTGKARVFAAALGITAVDAPKLRQQLLQAARTGEAEVCVADQYGQGYRIDFEMETPVGRALVRSAWIVPSKRTAPRLTTCYVRKRNK